MCPPLGRCKWNNGVSPFSKASLTDGNFSGRQAAWRYLSGSKLTHRPADQWTKLAPRSLEHSLNEVRRIHSTYTLYMHTSNGLSDPGSRFLGRGLVALYAAVVGARMRQGSVVESNVLDKVMQIAAIYQDSLVTLI